MSLIDDALKRTREQGGADTATGAQAPPKDPWAYAPLPEQRSRVGAGTVAMIAAGIILAGGIVFLLLKKGASAPPESAVSAAPGRTPTAAARSEEPLPTVEVASPPGRRAGPRSSTAAADSSVGAPSLAAQAPPAMAAGTQQHTQPASAASAASPAPSAAGSPGPASSAPRSAREPVSAAPRSASASLSAPHASRPAPATNYFPNASGSPRIDSAGSAANAAPQAPPIAAAPRSVTTLANVAPKSDGPRPVSSHTPAKNYVGSFVAPNGIKIDLGGIVYSEANPVALVNGRVLPPGGMVEGLLLVAVEENRVEFEGDGVHVFLSVK